MAAQNRSARVTITRLIIGTSLLILASIAVASAIVATGVNQIKVHGPLYVKIKSTNDLTADILPPPLYLIETYLTVLQLRATERPEEARALEAHLEQLRKDMEEREGYWAEQPLSQSVRDALTHGVLPTAHQLFEAVERRFLPALHSADAAAAISALKDISALYVKHRAAVDELVKRANVSIDGAEGEATAAEHLYLSAIYGILGLVGVIGFAVAWALVRRVARPITEMTHAMRALAGNDRSVEIPSRNRRDEIGAMAGAVQVFKESMVEAERLRAERETQKQLAEEQHRTAMAELAATFEATVGGIVGGVAAHASELRDTAQAMSATSEETSRQSASVAAASEQAAQNVQSVAGATEQLSASIREIAQQIGSSTEMIAAAVAEARRTDGQVQELAGSAERIGDVIGLINDIASQTNLLALNATIEAARAGDAGKGFAVVASEVKSLASQTAKATEDIAQQIKTIQDSTKSSVEAIRGIADRISKVNETAAAIAVAIEEQGAATQQIARNLEQASQGTAEVTATIGGVNQAAREAGSAAGQVLGAAVQLSQQADALRAQVGDFVAHVRAA
jgi:methyl-accepting chemotaxis protein